MDDWKYGQLRNLLSAASNGTTADQVDCTDSTVAVSRIETISGGSINLDKVGFIEKRPEIERYRLAIGDILFSHINSLPVIGNCALIEADLGLYSGMNLLRLRPKTNVDARFLHYQLKSAHFRDLVEAHAKPAINQASISKGTLLGLPVSIPPLATQTAIADYLDRKTAAIDALIDKKELLIEELRKYQEAVIAEALSHKSGWVAIPLKRVAYFNPTPPQSLSDSAVVSFLPMAAFSEFGALDLTQERTVKDIRAGYTYFRDGDVAYAKVTPCFENGKGAILRDLVGGCGFGTTELTVLRPKEQFDSRFLAYALRTKKFQQYGLAHMEGTGGLKRVPDRTAANFIQSFPGKAEQELIADALDKTLAKIARLTEKTIAQVSDLVSYRSALISETVSGKGAIK